VVTAALKQIDKRNTPVSVWIKSKVRKLKQFMALVFGKKEKNVVGWKAKALMRSDMKNVRKIFSMC